MLKTAASILIIDDEADICKMLVDFLDQHGYSATSAYKGMKGIEMVEQESFDLVLCDFYLGDVDGLEAVIRIKDIAPALPVIIITGYSDIKTAVKVVKQGAYDYITKPLYPDEILHTIERALSEAQAHKDGKPLGGTECGDMRDKFLPGESKQMQEVLQQVALVAPTDYRVLLTGESGTGKESIARSIHLKSHRRSQPFVVLDCGALPRDLAGSELFGHEKGAFTGAVAGKQGQFELAQGGTLFLDEIANLPYDVQVSLLRVLQEKRMRRIGGVKDITLDVRIIVASNEDIGAAVQRGSFRQDLYHRLNEFSISIPALRQRVKDIIPLAEFFMRETNDELNKNVHILSGEVTDMLLAYAWPGNVRELKNVIRRAVLITEGEIVEINALPSELLQGARNRPTPAHFADNEGDLSLKTSALEAEAAVIIKVLQQVNYNRTKAAQILNIDRKTLYNKMKAMNLRL